MSCVSFELAGGRGYGAILPHASTLSPKGLSVMAARVPRYWHKNLAYMSCILFSWSGVNEGSGFDCRPRGWFRRCPEECLVEVMPRPEPESAQSTHARPPQAPDAEQRLGQRQHKSHLLLRKADIMLLLALFLLLHKRQVVRVVLLLEIGSTSIHAWWPARGSLVRLLLLQKMVTRTSTRNKKMKVGKQRSH